MDTHTPLEWHTLEWLSWCDMIQKRGSKVKSILNNVSLKSLSLQSDVVLCDAVVFTVLHHLSLSSAALRLRSCLFCEGRISVLKRWFKTPIQNALHGSTVHASLEKKTISWACTAHCPRLLFELKWTGKAFIWRHLNVVICDFAFMLPPESAFCSNHDRKRTFLGCVHAYFAKAESAFWNADSKRRSKTPFTGVLFMLPSRRRRFREQALRIVRAQVNRKGVYMTSFKRGYMWFCVHASTRISVLL